MKSLSNIEIIKTRHQQLGFSLLELLVVVAIIGLLISILVPALGRARDHANLIACRSNLRNLILASLVYAGENGSCLPIDKKVDNPHKGLIEAVYDGEYITTMETFYCPSEKKEGLRFSEENFREGNISYFYYCYQNRPANRYLSNFLLKVVPWPRILDTDMDPQSWVLSDCWFSNSPTAHRWYKKGINYAILDGSVRMLKRSPRSEFK